MWRRGIGTLGPAMLMGALASLCISGPATARAPGVFSVDTDIGDTAMAGTASLHDNDYRITASGANIWGVRDAFHYVARPAGGDLSLAATVTWQPAGDGHRSDPHRKAGVMLRQNLSADAPYADVMVHGSGLVSLQYRETPGGDTHEIVANVPGVTRVRLDYQDGYAWMWLAGPDGVLHRAGGGVPVALGASYYAGLAVSAHDNTLSETADFSDVALEALPPAPVSKGYADKVESTLEVLDVESLNRMIVYHTTDHIEAPNWLPDNRLLFNSGGLIYTFKLPVLMRTTGPEGPQAMPVKLDTGSLNRINNDHGFSPDLKWLAVSDQSQGIGSSASDGASRVYVLPLNGGTPKRMTEQGPSYWHGWSPNGKTLAIIGQRQDQRQGDFDIYAVPVSDGGPVAGATETRLTMTPGLDDGAEYSPDGEWIWFNSVRSGNMKLWRMHPDGSDAQQMSFGDDSRDWFPHVSPDGKWIAFVSFGTEVAIGDHPPDHEVVLKIMPAGGGAPRVVARLFGGQGTMNVNSWSPDSRHLAFVSYRIVP